METGQRVELPEDMQSKTTKEIIDWMKTQWVTAHALWAVSY
jgi:hypothetical protein